jgi:hypothetical protein
VRIEAFSLCLALAAFPAAAARRAPADAPITLYTEFQQPAPPAVMEAMRTELDDIMRPLGMRFEWRSLAAREPQAASAALAVITFKGNCGAGHLSPAPAESGPLGWTHVSDGVILPFSDVDCDGIRHFLQASLLHLENGVRETAMGRAMGRVLAHELYHIFADTRHHAAHGVGKAAYTVRELLSSVFQFDEAEALALREPAEGSEPAAPAAPSTLAVFLAGGAQDDASKRK